MRERDDQHDCDQGDDSPSRHGLRQPSLEYGVGSNGFRKQRVKHVRPSFAISSAEPLSGSPLERAEITNSSGPGRDEHTTVPLLPLTARRAQRRRK